MQCVNCRFQNMPGSQTCGRCGTSLGLATAHINVHPPRASRLTRRLRRGIHRRAYYEARGTVAGLSARTAALFAAAWPHLPPFPVCWRMIVPGWSHLFLHQRRRGHLFLWGFLICLLPGILMLGTRMGSILLGLAFSIHTSAVLDLLNQTSPRSDLRMQMGRSIAVCFFVFIFLYFPAGWLLHQAANPQSIQLDDPPFQRGDVVLVNQWSDLAPGEVVLYRLPNYNVRGRRDVLYEYGGDHIDRILAGPNDRVLWKNGLLRVNGVARPWTPLAPDHFPAAMSFLVPGDHFLILPSTTLRLPAPAQSGIWRRLALIPCENVYGRVFLRTHPLSRFERIR